MPWMRRWPLSSTLLLLLGAALALLCAPVPAAVALEPPRACPPCCSCRAELLDCSRCKLSRLPHPLPGRIVRLDLSHNRIASINGSLFNHLHNLQEVKITRNELTTIPSFGIIAANITLLSLSNNKITQVLSEQLMPFQSMEMLDLSNNQIFELKKFPPLQLRYLYINNNKITSLDPGCFDNLSNTLQVLKLNRNKISSIPSKMFKLPHLQHLELSRNKMKKVDGLAFQGLSALKSLKLQRNSISKLMDGAFWGLSNIEILQLDFNNLTEVTKGWLYGLLMLQQLNLSQNAISKINPDAWEFCQKLSELDVSFNDLTRLEDSTFVGLSLLGQLYIGNNQVSYIADGAFGGLSSLHSLDLKNNEISWTIEDMNGAFSQLSKLRKLGLQGNRIRSITRKAFSGLDALEHLDLSNNAIMSVQSNTFSQMKKLHELYLNTSSLLCDCQLKWLHQWAIDNGFQSFINASCAHPQWLKGRSIFATKPEEFVCDDFPKPEIMEQPETQAAVKHSNVSFICSAASSSDSPMTFAWKKDNEVLHEAEIENYAHLRSQGGEVMEYTTILRLRHVNFSSEGKYQCVISNHFGSSYSNKAKLTVNMLPSFTKSPTDLTIRAGAMARLECAAIGHPTPQIAWQKDGGTDFPAARERRMHVMPEDDVFFIVDVKVEDIGIYSCTAQNSAGAISANSTLTVLETPSFVRPLVDKMVAKGETAVLQCIAAGSPPPKLNWTKDDSPLSVTERHFFAAGNQLLIIVDSNLDDAGKYTCEMSNTLGTERGHIRLTVLPTPNCDSAQGATSFEEDGWSTIGIVIIAVVCCVVGTSLVWVVIIYHTRRKSEDCSVTNTDETNLPADISSYLSSQGTLSDHQEGYGRSEAGSHHQLMTGSMNGYLLQHRGSDDLCHIDNGSDTDIEGISDPLVFHNTDRAASMYVGGIVYDAETLDIISHQDDSSDQMAVCAGAYNDSIYSKKKGYSQFIQVPPEDYFDQAVAKKITQLPNSNLFNPVQTPHIATAVDIPVSNGNPERLTATHNMYGGTFGKRVWRTHQDPYSDYVQPAASRSLTLHTPQGTLDSDCDVDTESECLSASITGKHNSTYEHVDKCRTPTFQPCRVKT
ncbi:leucine-rich repeats and immunoglobulin-like domains protein 3 [Amblyraja radiata]|uniref:leucine-rich repeats and immunoglobulin-like domains protein 3 n=1 Tax=Amblyraja radiata TaxID=386614 RepID=UPI0014029280|nr:leucine-rich repeats and immunoglobulin-like domains protein 3 [Amblyraja radiata]